VCFCVFVCVIVFGFSGSFARLHLSLTLAHYLTIALFINALSDEDDDVRSASAGSILFLSLLVPIQDYTNL